MVQEGLLTTTFGSADSFPVGDQVAVCWGSEECLKVVRVELGQLWGGDGIPFQMMRPMKEGCPKKLTHSRYPNFVECGKQRKMGIEVGE